MWHLQKRKTAAAGSDSDEAAADSEDDFEQPASKRGGGKKASASGGSKPAAAAASGGSKYGPKVEKLRRMCRAAGITVGPSVYVKVGAAVWLLAVVAVLVSAALLGQLATAAAPPYMRCVGAAACK
jgi:hypothetical protein